MKTDPLIKTTSEPLTAQEQFAAVDLDQDDGLDRHEYVSFVVMRSDAGDADYKAVVLSGDYDVVFASKDADADGRVTQSELGLDADNDDPAAAKDDVE